MHKLVIDPDGTITMIYADDLRALLQEGRADVRRVSHVEPCALGWIGGGWTADLSPIQGPVLGPFDTRAEALAAEVDYLNREGL